MSLQARLNLARTRKGLSFQKLATAAGCTKAHAWNLEKGTTCNPTVGLIERLAAALDVEPSWLAGWDEAGTVERAIDRMGWPEIHAFQERLEQDVYEDAGGFMLRKIKRLFGIRRDPLLTYQAAARAMFASPGYGGDVPEPYARVATAGSGTPDVAPANFSAPFHSSSPTSAEQ